MDLKRLSSKAKDLVDKRGGSDSLKQDADELKGIAKGQGSLADKAKAAVSAIKDPGAPGDEGQVRADASPAIQASEAERERADEKVHDEHRGKHAKGEGRGGGGGQGRHRRGERRGRDDDPAV